MKITFVKTGDRRFERTLKTIIQRRGEVDGKVEGSVRKIIQAVRQDGDRALLRYARTFDGYRLSTSDMEVKTREIDRAMKLVSKEDIRALTLAARRIARFHRRQLERSWEYRDPLGLVLGQRINPLENVGVYVPGGKASYPSTVLMSTIPAKVAGVKQVVMTSPIRIDAAPVLAAARIAGVGLPPSHYRSDRSGDLYGSGRTD